MKTLTKEYPIIENAMEALPKSIQKLLWQVGFFVFGFFLSQTTILDEYTPFGIALCAASGKKLAFVSAMGALCGCLITNNINTQYRYIAGAIAAATISFCVSTIKFKKNADFVAPLNGFFTCLLTGLTVAFAEKVSIDTVVFYVAESVLCGGAAYFFSRSLKCGRLGIRLKALPATDLAAIAISISILFMGATKLQIGEISPMRIVAVILILIASRYGGLASGGVVGIILGISSGMSGDLMFLAGAYAFGGMMAGLFHPLGQLGSGAAFAISCAVFAVLESNYFDVLYPMLEVAIGTTLFVMMPRKLGNKIDNFVNSKIDVSPTGSLRKSLVVKLRFAANAISGVSQSVESVSYKLKEITTPNVTGINKIVSNEICTDCNLKNLCFGKELEDTTNMFNKLLDNLKYNCELTAENIPPIATSRCIHIDQLANSFNFHYKEHCQREAYENKVSQVREVVADQFYGISDMLYDLSKEFDDAEVFDLETAEKIRMIMNNFDVYPRDVCCIVDKYERMRVEAHCPQPIKKLENAKMSEAISKECGRYFDKVSITLAGDEAMMSFCEKATFSMEIGLKQSASNGGKLCGDCVEVVNDGKGRQIIIISDGMGTGGRAAVDGAMASGLLARLIKAGFGFDCALRVVNSALLVKSDDESLATLDIVCVDLFTGRTDFYKAGAACSFVKKDNKAYKVELASLPAGILREVEFAKTSTFLESNDRIVLFSDGIIDNDTDWVRSLINDSTSIPAQELSEKIIKTAKENSSVIPQDDMTVVVADIH